MTNEEARELAIQFGALKPHGMVERMAAGVQAYGGSFSDSDVAKARLEKWTQAILEGRDPRNGRPLGFQVGRCETTVRHAAELKNNFHDSPL